MFTQKHLSMNVYSFVFKSPNLETTHMSFEGQIKQLWHIHHTEHNSAIKKEETIDTCNDLDEFPENDVE